MATLKKSKSGNSSSSNLRKDAIQKEAQESAAIASAVQQMQSEGMTESVARSWAASAGVDSAQAKAFAQVSARAHDTSVSSGTGISSTDSNGVTRTLGTTTTVAKDGSISTVNSDTSSHTGKDGVTRSTVTQSVNGGPPSTVQSQSMSTGLNAVYSSGVKSGVSAGGSVFGAGASVSVEQSKNNKVSGSASRETGLDAIDSAGVKTGVSAGASVFGAGASVSVEQSKNNKVSGSANRAAEGAQAGAEAVRAESKVIVSDRAASGTSTQSSTTNSSSLGSASRDSAASWSKALSETVSSSAALSNTLSQKEQTQKETPSNQGVNLGVNAASLAVSQSQGGTYSTSEVVDGIPVASSVSRTDEATGDVLQTSARLESLPDMMTQSPELASALTSKLEQVLNETQSLSNSLQAYAASEPLSPAELAKVETLIQSAKEVFPGVDDTTIVERTAAAMRESVAEMKEVVATLESLSKGESVPQEALAKASGMTLELMQHGSGFFPPEVERGGSEIKERPVELMQAVSGFFPPEVERGGSEIKERPAGNFVTSSASVPSNETSSNPESNKDTRDTLNPVNAETQEKINTPEAPRSRESASQDSAPGGANFEMNDATKAKLEESLPAYARELLGDSAKGMSDADIKGALKEGAAEAARELGVTPVDIAAALNELRAEAVKEGKDPSRVDEAVALEALVAREKALEKEAEKELQPEAEHAASKSQKELSSRLDSDSVAEHDDAAEEMAMAE